MRLSELAGAVAIEIVRDGEFLSLGLLSHRSPALLACLYDGRAMRECRLNPELASVLTSPALAGAVPQHIALAVADRPRARFADAQRYLIASTEFYGADVPTTISPGATVHPAAIVASSNVQVAAGCVIEAGAVVLERTTLEAGAVIRAGAVVGAEGFHPVPHDAGTMNLPHGGGVRIGPGVQVLSNAVVCRAVFHTRTSIGARTVVGPLAYIAHGVQVGADCRLAASARVAGSSVVGERVYIGPNAVISNGVRVDDDARVSIGAVVIRDVPAGQTVTGNFAVEHGRFLAAARRSAR